VTGEDEYSRYNYRRYTTCVHMYLFSVTALVGFVAGGGGGGVCYGWHTNLKRTYPGFSIHIPHPS
jgi:hypothetical protein